VNTEEREGAWSNTTKRSREHMEAETITRMDTDWGKVEWN
jgi:hypothetical protein